MKASAATPLPLGAQIATTRHRATRNTLLLATCAGLLMLILNVFHRESYSGDEGFYGVTALNMVHAPHYLIRPSYFPEGDFLVEKDAFAHPPFNSYFYALSLWLTGQSRVGPELINLIAFLALLYFSFRILALFDNYAARFAVLLLAASPAIHVSYSQLEAEPLMTSFGVAAVYCGLRSNAVRGRYRWLFLAGLCLGFSYALKLWLCGPLALAVAVAVYMRTRQWQGPLLGKIVGVVIFGLAFVIPAGAHLLAVGLTHPEDLPFWLNNIYFGVFASAGISGSKLGGAGVSSAWVHPFWYYGPALYRDHFFLLPILLAGLRSAWLELRGKRELSCIIGAGLFGLIPLSLMSVKEPLYVLSCAIFAYFLAGYCLAAMTRRFASGSDIDMASFLMATVASLGLLLVLPLAYLKGIQAGKITLPFVIAHSLFYLAFLILLIWAQRRSRAVAFEWPVFGACALAVAALFGYDCITRKPRDQAIAALMQPYIQPNAPASLSLIASNFKSYQFYSFHHGCYWHELPLQQAPENVLSNPTFSTVRAFILDADDQAKPEMRPWLAWLENNAVEKTGDLNARLGGVSGFRLFLREPRSASRPGSPQARNRVMEGWSNGVMSDSGERVAATWDGSRSGSEPARR